MKDVQLEVCTKQQLTIIGGKFHKDQIDDFIGRLPQHMPWAICEHSNGNEFLLDTLPETKYLERIRKFGKTGDIDIRLDEDNYHWRYIGNPDSWDLSDYSYQDFWTETKIEKLYIYKEKMLLWGRRNSKGNYFEGKVASANLNYPISSPEKNRVTIYYNLYTHMGRPQFTWYYSLEG